MTIDIYKRFDATLYQRQASNRSRRRHIAKRRASAGVWPCRGFTLVEVIASLVLISVMLTGILLAYHRTMTAVTQQILRERALAVGQRHMETLLAQLQEPNSVNLPTRDELDPLFTWELDLKRVNVSSGTTDDITHTVIQATVRVTPDESVNERSLHLELVRYIPDLKPIPGEAIAVPLKPDYMEEDWYLALKDKLGRDPTQVEIFQHYLGDIQLPKDFFNDWEDTEVHEDF